LQRGAGRLTDKEGALLAGLAGKAHVWLDQELEPAITLAPGEVLPFVPFEHHTEMERRHGMAVDRVGRCALASIDEVCGNLVAEQVEIDPAAGFAPDAG